MIIYSATLEQFNTDVYNGEIARKIEESFARNGISHSNERENRAFRNSLPILDNVLLHSKKLDGNTNIAIEYRLPLSSKRIDFMISGDDASGRGSAVIIELKQWDKVEDVPGEDLVRTYVANANRLMAHPSYQAYSYVSTIINMNEDVRKQGIGLYPCSYLHNYPSDSKSLSIIRAPKFSHLLKESPVYVSTENSKLLDYIESHIAAPDGGKTMSVIENGRIKPSPALQDSIGKMLQGKEVFKLIDEQKVAFEMVKNVAKACFEDGRKNTIIIEGGPGTGKSVIAINLLASFIKSGRACAYVTKNAAPRNVFSQELIEDDYKKSYISGLFKGSGSFVDCQENEYDVLIVDEAHRLNEKSGLYGNQGEDQIKEIIKSSKLSVFFIDEDQIVTTKDHGSIENIKNWAKKLGSIVHYGDEFKLVSQFRCKGGDAYLAFIDNLLQIRETANSSLEDSDYDIRVYDDLNAMREDLRLLNSHNKARIVAGYCYPWLSKKNPASDVFDINIGDFHAKWNFASTSTWAIDPDSFDQVGCIHTSQGLEFEYVGVIIGHDLYYRDGKVMTDYTVHPSSDAAFKGIKSNKNFALADRIIRNTYRTLLTRGQKGCYVYCEDKELAKYINNLSKKFKICSY